MALFSDCSKPFFVTKFQIDIHTQIPSPSSQSKYDVSSCFWLAFLVTSLSHVLLCESLNSSQFYRTHLIPIRRNYCVDEIKKSFCNCTHALRHDCSLHARLSISHVRQRTTGIGAINNGRNNTKKMIMPSNYHTVLRKSIR